MQGDPSTKAGNGRRYLGLLVAAHLATATATVALAAVIGQQFLGGLPATGRIAVLAVAAVVAAGVDLAAAARRRMSLGLRRQTPKELGHDTEAPWWLTPFIWGADTGLLWSTFRVTSLTWVVLLAALLGLAPAGTGLVYGVAFTVPVAVSVLVGRGRHIGRIGSRFAGRGAQVIQVVSALALLGPVTLALVG